MCGIVLSYPLGEMILCGCVGVSGNCGVTRKDAQDS